MVAIARSAWCASVGLSLLSGGSAACAASDAAQAARTSANTNTVPPGRTLKLASWNLEWLMTPQTYDALLPICDRTGQPGSDRRAFPCTPGRAPLPRRTAQDFDALARHARRLDADAVALQEVDGSEPAALVFRQGYAVDCFTTRAHPQKTGFAIRAGIAYRCNPEYAALDVDGGSRAGADVTLFPGTTREIRLLSVHLKSGCFDQRLDHRRNEACAVLRRQVPVLERWIDARVREGVRFAVMGDFNRRLARDAMFAAGPDEDAPLNLFQALSDDDPPGAVLVRASQGAAFVPCSARDRHAPAYIDDILLGPAGPSMRTAPHAFSRLVYDEADAAASRLSDHCPVAVRLLHP